MSVRQAATGFAAFAALALFLTIGIAWQTKGFPWGAASGYTLSAAFEDVTGLSAGDPVYLAGVPVGEVL